MPDPFDDDIPPITWLAPEDFDALLQRLDQPASFDPRIARVLAASALGRALRQKLYI